MIVMIAVIVVRLKTSSDRKRNSQAPLGGDKQMIVHHRGNGQTASTILEADTDPDLIQVKYPSVTLKSQQNGGVAQFPGDPRTSSLGWIATGTVVASPSPPPALSPSAGTLRRGSLKRTLPPVANERSPAPVSSSSDDNGRRDRWDDASTRPFSYTHHQQQPLPQVLLRQHSSSARDQQASELNGAAIKETLMMSSDHIPESCV